MVYVFIMGLVGTIQELEFFYQDAYKRYLVFLKESRQMRVLYRKSLCNCGAFFFRVDFLALTGDGQGHDLSPIGFTPGVNQEAHVRVTTDISIFQSVARRCQIKVFTVLVNNVGHQRTMWNGAIDGGQNTTAHAPDQRFHFFEHGLIHPDKDLQNRFSLDQKKC